MTNHLTGPKSIVFIMAKCHGYIRFQWLWFKINTGWHRSLWVPWWELYTEAILVAVPMGSCLSSNATFHLWPQPYPTLSPLSQMVCIDPVALFPPGPHPYPESFLRRKERRFFHWQFISILSLHPSFQPGVKKYVPLSAEFGGLNFAALVLASVTQCS